MASHGVSTFPGSGSMSGPVEDRPVVRVVGVASGSSSYGPGVSLSDSTRSSRVTGVVAVVWRSRLGWPWFVSSVSRGVSGSGVARPVPGFIGGGADSSSIRGVDVSSVGVSGPVSWWPLFEMFGVGTSSAGVVVVVVSGGAVSGLARSGATPRVVSEVVSRRWG